MIPSGSTGTAPHDDVIPEGALLRERQLEFLVANSRVSVAASILNATIFLVVLFAHLPAGSLLLWYGALVLFSLPRLVAVFLFPRLRERLTVTQWSWLLALGTIAWQIPTAFLLALGLSATLAWYVDPLHCPPPGLQLFSGATMLGAFFIATDPVTASTTPKGRRRCEWKPRR